MHLESLYFGFAI